MTRNFMVAAVLALAGAVFFSGMAWAGPDDEKAPKKKTEKEKGKRKASKVAGEFPALSFTMKDIDGQDQDLRQYAGKVVLMVNVASQCGFTSQYKGLQSLYAKYKDKGFVILGFPANEFGHQEPGSNEEIKAFCTSKYSVTFPMFAKTKVKGQGINPLYKYLTDEKAGHKFGGDIKWNFTKFLINRRGEIVDRFDSRVKPDEDKLVQAVDKALAEPKPAGTGKESTGG
ncbi:MAG TPA: glutathione peroxidase [Phycisphaerae bacterium]|nr:glutathione peroxidase [Phycisphaerae bacterium]